MASTTLSTKDSKNYDDSEINRSIHPFVFPVSLNKSVPQRRCSESKPSHPSRTLTGLHRSNSLPLPTSVITSSPLQLPTRTNGRSGQPFKLRPSPAAEEWQRQKSLGAVNPAIDELMDMIGLEEVKRQVLNIKAKVEVCKRQKVDLRSERFNIIFQGNPGTGKTTVARLYARFLKSVGLLTTDTVTETSGSKLSSIGPRGTQQEINEMMDGGGGVLFVDEAYQLTAPHTPDSGRQVLDILLTEMENLIGKLVIIFVGYNKDMESFFEHNPGLASRIPYTLQFNDFDDAELWTILSKKIIKKYGGKMVVDGGMDGLYMRVAIRRLGRGRNSKGFGNARAVEILLANISARQAERVAKAQKLKDAKRSNERDLREKECQQAQRTNINTNTTEDQVGVHHNFNGPKEPNDDAITNNLDCAPINKDESNAPENKALDSAVIMSELNNTPEDIITEGKIVSNNTVEDSVSEFNKDCHEKESLYDAGSNEDPQRITDGNAPDSDDKANKCRDSIQTISCSETGEEKETVNETRVPSENDPQVTANTGKITPSHDDHEGGEIPVQPGDRKSQEIVPSDIPKSVMTTDQSNDSKGQPNDAGAGNVEDDQTPTRDLVETPESKSSAHEELPEDDPMYFQFTQEDLIGPNPTHALPQCAAWIKLQGLIGLQTVKDAARSMIDLIITNYRRELAEKNPLQFSLNRVFLGNPGTGKTTVAKLYGQILADLGLLSNGEVVVKNPSDFIGQCLGKSEARTRSILQSTVGKVLIIDEAYMLNSGGHDKQQNEYKTGVIDTLVAEVQGNPGDDRCVLLLGYEDRMVEMFQNVNPGLGRRFAVDNPFKFEDYKLPELNAILRLKMKEQDITATRDALLVASQILDRARTRPNFGNGGDVENLLSTAKMNYQMRQSVINVVDRPFDALLLPKDFDRHYMRVENAITNCETRLKGNVSDDIIRKLRGYLKHALGLRSMGVDPRGQVPSKFVFKGPPGTGKTTAALDMGKIYYEMGFLSTDEVVEVSATELIGTCVGQTGPKTISVLGKAVGKVLLIDEAYRLAEGTYATEAVNEIVYRLKQPQYSGMVVILAGGTMGMNHLLASRQALSGMFPEEIIFRNISPLDSVKLLGRELDKTGIVAPFVNPSSPDYIKVEKLFTILQLFSTWSNARDIETLARQMSGVAYGYNKKSVVSTDQALHFMKEMIKVHYERSIDHKHKPGSLPIQTDNAPPPLVEDTAAADAPVRDISMNTEAAEAQKSKICMLPQPSILSPDLSNRNQMPSDPHNQAQPEPAQPQIGQNNPATAPSTEAGTNAAQTPYSAPFEQHGSSEHSTESATHIPASLSSTSPLPQLQPQSLQVPSFQRKASQRSTRSSVHTAYTDAVTIVGNESNSSFNDLSLASPPESSVHTRPNTTQLSDDAAVTHAQNQTQDSSTELQHSQELTPVTSAASSINEQEVRSKTVEFLKKAQEYVENYKKEKLRRKMEEDTKKKRKQQRRQEEKERKAEEKRQKEAEKANLKATGRHFNSAEQHEHGEDERRSNQCEAGYEWLLQTSGDYVCAGGSHTATAAQVEG